MGWNCLYSSNHSALVPPEPSTGCFLSLQFQERSDSGYLLCAASHDHPQYLAWNDFNRNSLFLKRKGSPELNYFSNSTENKQDSQTDYSQSTAVLAVSPTMQHCTHKLTSFSMGCLCNYPCKVFYTHLCISLGSERLSIYYFHVLKA